MMKKIPLFLLLIPLFMAPHAARAGSQYSIGIEGFYDKYREPGPDVDVTTKSPYGSLTAGYAYNWPGTFVALDGRFSYGEADYHSSDGVSKNTPQYDGEVRGRAGLNIGNFSPYTGFGGRFFLDRGDGTVTTLGFGGYDRHIQQYYVPVGADWQFDLGQGLTVTPNVEYDQLVYGHVRSDLSPFIGQDISNKQHNGYGLRGSVMFGQTTGTRGNAWQFGPFVRYWNIKRSDFDDVGGGVEYYEPHNTRVQVGAKLRYVFK